MRTTLNWLIAATLLAATGARADGDKVEAAIGGGVGGAVGAVVGEELGGRKGAIVGAAAGAAVGAAIATDDDDGKERAENPVEVKVSAAGGHPAGRHCPPGQAKKGRC